MQRIAVLLAVAIGVGAEGRRWMDANLPVQQRVADLLPKLSVEELAVQLMAPNNMNADQLIASFAKTSVGTSTMLGLQGRNRVQAAVLNNSRWSIPVAFQHESLHSGCFGGTIFPMPLTLGSSWNTSLVRAVYAAVGDETYKCGAGIAFAPVINLFTDPRFGRFHEAFSPDPTLTAKMAVASVAGLQGGVGGNASTYLPEGRVVSLAKHFVAYGAASGGLNAAGTMLHERELRDVYLKPWKAFAAAGGRGAMPSHQTALSIPMHANAYLVNDVFRHELGFGPGLTISDCNDCNVLVQYRLARNVSEAAALAIKSGVDQDLQCMAVTYTPQNIQAALSDGLLTLNELRTAVSHVLTMKFASGLFDKPYANESGTQGLNPPEYQQLAKEAVEEGAVLLKNDGNVLPLTDAAPAGGNWNGYLITGALGGSSGTAVQGLLGPYSSEGAPVATVAGSLRGASYSLGASPDSAANASEIQQAVSAAQGAKAVLVVVGDSIKTCGEWIDRSELTLPGGQAALLSALLEAVPEKVIVVLVSGRPITFDPAVFPKIHTMLWIGRPGEQAGVALADLLTGASEPTGRLNAPWPKRVGHIWSGAQPFQQERVGKWVANGRSTPDPDGRVYSSYVDDAWGEARPLFPFGFGLSYAGRTFVYSNLKLSFPEGSGAVYLTATVTVKNTGTRAGTEVVQVYLVDPAGGILVRPWKRLAGFKKVLLAPGEQKDVAVTVDKVDVEMSSNDVRTSEVQSGVWTVRAGGSSITDALSATFTV